MRLSYSDTLENACLHLAAANAGAATVLAEIVGRCRDIDPGCNHPFEYLLALDRWKVYGPFLWVLYKDACDCDLVKMLAVLRFTLMGRYRPSDLRALIARSQGQTGAPWAKPIDPTHTLHLLRAIHPEFGAQPS